ncbi:MAG: hypothetical protein SGILL_008395, partial [Bacillariaceae sp.]
GWNPIQISIENIEVFINTNAEENVDGGSAAGEERVITGVILDSNPLSRITYDEQITLNLNVGSCTPAPGCASYTYAITSLTAGTTDITTLSTTTISGTSATIQIPIALFAAAGQGGFIPITAVVSWSVSRRRGLRELQGDEPTSGTAIADVSVSVDPEALDEAQNFVATTAGGATLTFSTTIMAAAGGLAALAL